MDSTSSRKMIVCAAYIHAVVEGLMRTAWQEDGVFGAESVAYRNPFWRWDSSRCSSLELRRYLREYVGQPLDLRFSVPHNTIDA